MKAPTLLPLCFVLFSVGCSTTEPRLPTGTYREMPPTPNFLIVSGGEITVHIDGIDERDKGQGLAFSYTIYPDGDFLLGVDRSAKLFYGYPALHYVWKGDKIAIKDRRSSPQWDFFRKEPN
jgi:hypothetical protein